MWKDLSVYKLTHVCALSLEFCHWLKLKISLDVRQKVFVGLFFFLHMTSFDAASSLSPILMYHPDSFYLHFIFLPDVLHSSHSFLWWKLLLKLSRLKGKNLQNMYLLSEIFFLVSLFSGASFGPRELFLSCSGTDEFWFIAVFKSSGSLITWSCKLTFYD